VLLSCPDGAVVGGAGLPQPLYQEFLSFDESLLHSRDARDDGIRDRLLLRDDLLPDASKIIPTPAAPLPDARDDTHAPHPTSPRRPPCFRLFSEVSFVESFVEGSGPSDRRDEAAPAMAAPAHHTGRSCGETGCVSVLVDDRRDEEPPWMIGEADATMPRPPSDDGAVHPCMDANAPKRKRSWKPRRLLVAIFR